MSALARLVAWILFAKGLLGSFRSGDNEDHDDTGDRGAGRGRDAGRDAGRMEASSSSTGGSASASPRAASGDAVEGRDDIPTQKSDSPGPDSPLELEAGDWKATLKRTAKEIKDDRVTLAAAGMAYYFVLSIFPALIAFVGVLGLLDISPGPISESISNALPRESARVLTSAIAEASRSSDQASLTAAIIGIAIALWSGSSGMVAMQGGLNIAYDVPRDRKFIGKRLVALLLLVATGILGGVPSPLLTFGDAWYFVGLGWVLTLVAVSVLFSLYYYIGPNRESPTWQWVSIGGVVGMALWIVASVAFNLYVSSLGNYSKTYGPFAGVIVLILWLFISSLAVLIGGELNAEVERQGERRARAA